MLGLMGGPAVITASVALLATNSRRFPKWIVVIDAVLIVVVVASTATFFPLESAGVSYADQDLPDPTALDAWRNAVVTVVAVSLPQ
jgi:hypothetical protein